MYMYIIVLITRGVIDTLLSIVHVHVHNSTNHMYCDQYFTVVHVHNSTNHMYCDQYFTVVHVHVYMYDVHVHMWY